eukprot:534980_1
MAVSTIDKLNCLVNGYLNCNIFNQIRCQAHEIRLISMIEEYLTSMLMKFSNGLFDSLQMELVDDHHIKMIFGCGGTVLIDCPMDVKDKSLQCKWKVKIKGTSFPNYHYFVGIASNRLKTFNTSPNFGKGDFTGIRGARFPTPSKILDKTNTDVQRVCRDSETLIVEYDGNHRELKFSSYNTILKMADKVDAILKIPDQIHEDIHFWYPAISLCSPPDSAKIVF